MQSKHAMTSNRQDWETPDGLFEDVVKEFGEFDLDAAASKHNAKATQYYTILDDALTRPWNGRVWCNPPYGRGVGAWVKKAWEEARSSYYKGRITRVVMLLSANTDTKWFHEYCQYGNVWFIPGRLKFKGAAGPAPFASMIVSFPSIEDCDWCLKWPKRY